jgi:hypothetical protein
MNNKRKMKKKFPYEKGGTKAGRKEGREGGREGGGQRTAGTEAILVCNNLIL